MPKRLPVLHIEQPQADQGQQSCRIPEAIRFFSQDNAGQNGGHNGRNADGSNRADGNAATLDPAEEEYLKAQQSQRGGEQPPQRLG